MLIKMKKGVFSLFFFLFLLSESFVHKGFEIAGYAAGKESILRRNRPVSSPWRQWTATATVQLVCNAVAFTFRLYQLEFSRVTEIARGVHRRWR